MEMSQNDVDALLNSKRVEDAPISNQSPAAGPMEPLKTFRKFITDSRKRAGIHFGRLKEKEAQLIRLHKQTVDNIKHTKTINKDAIDFFEQRRRDYEGMINLILSTSRAGRIVAVPSYGSLALR
jgi:hypothetical protein